MIGSVGNVTAVALDKISGDYPQKCHQSLLRCVMPVISPLPAGLLEVPHHRIRLPIIVAVLGPILNPRAAAADVLKGTDLIMKTNNEIMSCLSR